MTGISKRGARLSFTFEGLGHAAPEAQPKYRKVPLTAEQIAEKKAVKKALKLLKRSEFATWHRDDGYTLNDITYNLERL